MLDERSIYLINANLDGELDAAEEAELQAMLEKSAEARQMAAELGRLTRLIGSLPEHEAPPGLARRIVERVSPPAKRHPGFSLSRLFEGFRPAPVGLAFAAGLLASVAIYELGPRGVSVADPSELVGTMVSRGQENAAVQRDFRSFSGNGLSGTVALRRNGDIVELNFKFEAAKPAQIDIALESAGLNFGGMAHVSPVASGGDETYRVSGGRLSVESQGRQAFSIFLPQSTREDGNQAEISIGISSGGAAVFSGVLRG